MMKSITLTEAERQVVLNAIEGSKALIKKRLQLASIWGSKLSGVKLKQMLQDFNKLERKLS